MTNKHEFPFNKIVGAPDELKKDIEEEWHENIGDVWEARRQEFLEYEKPLSEGEKKLVERTQKYVDKIAKRYGGEPKPIPPESIYVLRPGAVYEVTDGAFRDGYNNLVKRMVVFEWKDSGLESATSLAHEMFHLKGYNALRVSPEEHIIHPYRSGMSMHSKDHQVVYFHQIEEALVTEAVKMVVDKYFKGDSFLAEEIKDVDLIKKWLDRLLTRSNYSEEKKKDFLEEIYAFPDSKKIADVLRSKQDDMFKLGYLQTHVNDLLKNEEILFRERKEERNKLDTLMETVLEYSDGAYRNRQEVLDVFLRAHFSGRLLPLAKMLEKSFAKGAFRQVAEDFALFGDAEETAVRDGEE